MDMQDESLTVGRPARRQVKIYYYMIKLLLYIVPCLFLLPSYAQSQKVNISTELNRLSFIKELPKYDEYTIVREFSSYDTTGQNDDGFSGKYSFIRKNPNGSLVLFEAAGNGVVNRIWTPTPNEDTLDFYFGGSDHSSFSIKFSDLFSGKIFPFTLPLCGNQLGGYYCYFPIPYKNGCKIVSRGKHIQFYQIQYRNFPDDYQVKNFNPNLNSEDKSSYEKLIAKWKKSYDPALEKNNSIKPIHIDKMLFAGQTITLATINGGGRIAGIKLQPAGIFTGLQKQIDIRICWDDEKYPAIYAPVADFFGYAFGTPSIQSLLLGSTNNINYCYFPMPFDSKAKIELVYRPLPDRKKTEPLRIKADIYYSLEKRNPKTEGKFYTLWNKDINPPWGKPHVF